MIELSTIKATRREDGTYAFVAIFRQATNYIDVPVSTLALQEYAAFQRTVLLSTGHIFRFPRCEGRLPESADSNWREIVQVLLEDNSAKPTGLN